MNSSLVINPFLQLVTTGEAEDGYFLVAPKPESGLQELEISRSKNPNLHELFLDLVQTRFDFIDVEKDLDEDERDLLYRAGVLVETGREPERTLFACHLDDFEDTGLDSDVSALMVNPTFHFEPFNFANFISWVHEKRLSPYKPSVWLKEPVSEIETGIWLEPEEGEIVSKFTAGEKLTFEIKPELLSRLTAAGILTTAEALAENERKTRAALERANIKFNRDKYVTFREMLPAAQMKALRRYYRHYVNQGFMPLGDQQVNRRFYQHNELLAGLIHKNLTKFMTLITGEEVIPSYVYAASYLENADLKPHLDRPQCEFSISLQIDYLPEAENQLSPWGLFLREAEMSADGKFLCESEEFPASREAEDENTAVYLASGDGLIYKGRELVHYRYALSDGHRSTSLFFHYVPKDFEGQLN